MEKVNLTWTEPFSRFWINGNGSLLFDANTSGSILIRRARSLRTIGTMEVPGLQWIGSVQSLLFTSNGRELSCWELGSATRRWIIRHARIVQLYVDLDAVITITNRAVSWLSLATGEYLNDAQVYSSSGFEVTTAMLGTSIVLFDGGTLSVVTPSSVRQVRAWPRPTYNFLLSLVATPLWTVIASPSHLGFFDSASMTLQDSIEFPHCHCLVVTPNKHWMAAAGKSRRIAVFSMDATRAMVNSWMAHDNSIIFLRCWGNNRLISCDRKGVLRFWNLHTGEQLRELHTRAPPEGMELGSDVLFVWNHRGLFKLNLELARRPRVALWAVALLRAKKQRSCPKSSRMAMNQG